MSQTVGPQTGCPRTCFLPRPAQRLSLFSKAGACSQGAAELCLPACLSRAHSQADHCKQPWQGHTGLCFQPPSSHWRPTLPPWPHPGSFCFLMGMCARGWPRAVPRECFNNGTGLDGVPALLLTGWAGYFTPTSWERGTIPVPTSQVTPEDTGSIPVG